MSSRSSESVGSLLADIATCLSDGLRIFALSDKRHWGQDEHEQVVALQQALDRAKKDFQDMGPLVNGSEHYQRDHKHESIQELRALRTRYQNHILNLKEWSRSGGAINPIWIRETHLLQRDLHRAQLRAACRIFAYTQESATTRCLGAFLVHRKQRIWSNSGIGVYEGEYQRRYLEELMVCKTVGGFQRFGESDIAFICDFCDAHIVWEDLEDVPTVRAVQGDTASPTAPVSPINGSLHWQAAARSLSTGAEKQVVFAPLAIANHSVPPPGGWRASLICPFCEDEGGQPLDEDDEEGVWKPDNEFDNVEALREHLEYQHTPQTTILEQMNIRKASDSCAVM